MGMKFKPTPKEKTKPSVFSVVLPPELNRLLEQDCERLNLKKADLVRQMITFCLENMDLEVSA
jgi:predicted DNA-binding protein